MVYFTPMKSILWILNGCGLEGRGITGGPVRFHEVSKRFAADGRVQHLLTTPGGKQMLTTLGCQLPITIVPASLLLRAEPCRPFRFWSYLITSLLWHFSWGGGVSPALWRLRASKLPKTDVLITVSDYFCDIVPALALKKRTGAKWIAWIHHCETDPKERPGNRFVNELTFRMQRWSFKQIAAHADSAWINDTLAGDEIERRLIALGMDKSKIRRMQNGIDLAAIGGAGNGEQGTGNGSETDAVMIGVRPNKGLHDIIPIWQMVQKLRPGTTLTLMGGMSGETEVVKDIERLKLPISIFKPKSGFLPAADYYAKIKEAKILFAPSHEEGWGIAVCEAMAAGLPVVAYDLPAYRKIYPGAYSAVPCFDHAMFAHAVARVLSDPAEYARLQNLGRICASQYDWNVIAASDSAAL